MAVITKDRDDSFLPGSGPLLRVGDSEAEIGEKVSDQAKSACLQCIAGVYIRTGESQSVQVSGLTVGHTG